MKRFLCIMLLTLLLGVPSMYHFYSLNTTLTAFVQALSYSIIFLYLANKSKTAKIVFYTILYFLFIVETFTFIHFGSRLDPNILSIILQTDIQEIKGFFSVYVFSAKTLIYLIIAVILYFLLLKHILLADFNMWFKDRSLNIFLIVVSLLEMITPALPLPLLRPKGGSTLYELYNSFIFVRANHTDLDKYENMISKISIFKSPQKEDSPNIVLIIGESFNMNHSKLYGYELNTSPYLSKEKNLIILKNAMSPTNATHSAMKYLFTLKSCNNKKKDTCQYVLLPAVFKKARYKVAYFDNQYTRSEGGVMDYSCGYFLNPKNVNKNCFDYRNDKTFRLDGDFIDYYKPSFIYDKKSLNIIHLKGQHLPPKNCYPKNFDIFKDSDILRKELNKRQKKYVAEYDNATLYNDFVIYQIINCFRMTDAIVIYFPDHGENVYDDKLLTIGRTFENSKNDDAIKNVYHIPFIIWCSDAFIAKHPDKYEALHLSSDKKICSDDIPFLLFDLASIDMNYNDKTRSFIGLDYIPHNTSIE